MFFSPSESWIPREFQGVVVGRLLDLGLLKFDNARSLPLKSGGTTDVYVNLRDARNRPEAITFLADLYRDPLRRLEVQRFVEVPDSVSCFAGPLSVGLGIPYLTIRSELKDGRVGNARTIGQSNSREGVCIIDDVITDGASKVGPSAECDRLELKTRALVVLVDRQQGWQKRKDLPPVWAGMTLHDVRRELIGMGEMKRCDSWAEERNPIIVALDGKSWEEILPIVDQLRTTGCILKVNDLLFEQGMEHLLPELSVYGRVMVDLKAHDIPNTVENICRRLAKYNVWAVTVHASGGREMVEAAKRALAGTNTKVLAVTVLTSLDDEACTEIYNKLPLDQVRRLAHVAFSAGADGLVCSPHEVPEVRAGWPNKELIYVTPGIRSEGADQGDQARVSTPKGAKDNGADYLVMGRQILGANDPVSEVRRVLGEELGIVL